MPVWVGSPELGSPVRAKGHMRNPGKRPRSCFGWTAGLQRVLGRRTPVETEAGTQHRAGGVSELSSPLFQAAAGPRGVPGPPGSGHAGGVPGASAERV